jgi:hypothetical protein
MGILDEAIREHLDLKRRRGAEDDELKELEDEAFGPPGRPAAPGADESVPSPQGERADEVGVAPREPSDEPAPEPADEVPSETIAEAAPEGPVFHDLAAEEGFVIGRLEEPTAEPMDEPVGPETFDEAVAEARATLPVDERPSAEAVPEVETSEEPPAEEPAPEAEEASVGAESPSLEDTQVHDMEAELASDAEVDEADVEPVGASERTDEVAEPVEEIELEEVELELDEADLELTEEEPEQQTSEPAEPAEDEEPAGDDVLEETPEFLRDTPESDRLWFEQGQPKDFDFDDEK